MKLKELVKSVHRTWQVNYSSSVNQTKNNEILVSLTTIESRLSTVFLTIKSLLRQSIVPYKVILWVEKSLQKKIPRRLKKLEGELFEIHFVDSTLSHRKLVCALEYFSSEYIVTCDDDVMYPDDWLQRLMENSDNENYITAHECRRIITNDKGELKPYKQWPYANFGETSINLIAIGWGGVLYPRNLLHSDIMEASLYTKLTPTADDIWFKAMSALNEIPVRRTTQPHPQPIPIPFTQKRSLKKINVKTDRNIMQWKAVCERYPLLIRLGTK